MFWWQLGPCQHREPEQPMRRPNETPITEIKKRNVISVAGLSFHDLLTTIVFMLLLLENWVVVNSQICWSDCDGRLQSLNVLYFDRGRGLHFFRKTGPTHFLQETTSAQSSLSRPPSFKLVASNGYFILPLFHELMSDARITFSPTHELIIFKLF